MITKTQGDDKLGQYILGGLDERERERIEAEYFEDDDAFEQMLIAEEELDNAPILDLQTYLRDQPERSDDPLLLLARHGADSKT